MYPYFQRMILHLSVFLCGFAEQRDCEKWGEFSSSPQRQRRLKGRSLTVLQCIIWNSLKWTCEWEKGWACCCHSTSDVVWLSRQQWQQCRSHFEKTEPVEGTEGGERTGERGYKDVCSAAACIMCYRISFACTQNIKHAPSQPRVQTPRQPHRGRREHELRA